ncbi:hypothetical protein [Caldisericum sp.]|uniref:hypothetical protein n=1 Tax=Caldisericum sp. TaxID=2499687 RepID=UPI003D0DB5B4
MNWKTILHWINRNILIILGISFISLGILKVYPQWFEDVLFATLIAIGAEFIAIGLSNLAVYLYTNISFIKGIVYGQNDKLEDSERMKFIPVLGQIFISVHVLVAIIVSMLFWGKIG